MGGGLQPSHGWTRGALLSGHGTSSAPPSPGSFHHQPRCPRERGLPLHRPRFPRERGAVAGSGEAGSQALAASPPQSPRHSAIYRWQMGSRSLSDFLQGWERPLNIHRTLIARNVQFPIPIPPPPSTPLGSKSRYLSPPCSEANPSISLFMIHQKPISHQIPGWIFSRSPESTKDHGL